MSILSDILERAKPQPCSSQPLLETKRETQQKTEERTQTEDIEYTNGSVGQQGYQEPDKALFVAIYTPFLRNPTNFDIDIFRAYKDWLLYPSCYVLNTFPRFNLRHFSYLLLKNNQDNIAKNAPDSLYKIAMLLWDIELTVPASYMEAFEIIASGEATEKNLTFSDFFAIMNFLRGLP